MKFKINFPFVLILITALVISFLHCPWFDIFFDDKEIFKYTGMAICRGGIPYIAFFDHKPPLIFFFNIINYKLGSWVFWFFDTALVSFTALLFLKVCLQTKIKYLYILPIVFIILIRNPFLSMGIGMTREYSSIFLLLFFCVLQLNFKLKYFWAGILLGLTFFMQQDQIIIFLPLVIYTLFSLKKKNKIISKYILSISIGFLLIAIPILLYFIANNALVNFWQDAFLFNLNWYTEKIAALKQFKLLNSVLSSSKTDFIFYSTLLLLLFSFLKSKNNRWLIVTAIATLFLSFISEYLTGKLAFGLVIQYYALPISATIPIALFIIFTQTNFITKYATESLVYAIVLFCFPLLLNLLQFATNTPKQDYMGTKNSPEIKLLSQTNLKDNEVYVAFNSNYDFVYNQHKILSPSPLLYNSFWNWYANWDNDNSKMKILTNDLEKNKTQFILNFADSGRIKNKINYIYWNNYIKNNFEPVVLPDSSFSKILWKRKVN